MAKVNIPIVGQSYYLQDWSVDCQRTVNLYPQAVESGNAPQVTALLPTPGLVKKFEFTGAIRGLYALADFALCVAGTTLYKINKDGSTAPIGTINGTSQVSFADNGFQVMIVGNSSYSYVIATGVLSKINDEGFLGATAVTFVDSRFVVSVPDSGRIQWSGLLNTTFNALDYATAEGKSDNLVSVMANQRELWLIGESTTEVWFGTGANGAPFERMQGAFLNVGCAAKDSIALFGSSLVWLSKTESGQGIVVMTNGYQPQRISNHAVESALSNYTRIDDAISYCYQQDGHSFLVMTFPAASKTWCFDVTTGMWHERASLDEDYNQQRHRTTCHCFFNGQHLVGDYENGMVYVLSNASNKDNDRPIMRERITPVLNAGNSRMRINSLEIMAQMGQQGNTSPQVTLSWSDDRGRSWSNGQNASLGGVGEFGRRMIFRRLGICRNRVFRLRMTDDARLVLLDSSADIEVLRS